MAHVMRNDDKRRVFELSCFRAYNILRKHSARFLNLYMLVRVLSYAPPPAPLLGGTAHAHPPTCCVCVNAHRCCPLACPNWSAWTTLATC